GDGPPALDRAGAASDPQRGIAQRRHGVDLDEPRRLPLAVRRAGRRRLPADAQVRPPGPVGRPRRASRPRAELLMDLETFWFCVIACFWAGYLTLEGFDFGVGMLLPFLPRDEAERSAMLRSIGPVWDGNEVWLVVAGGATFAAFPAWYGTMFSGFYLAL